MADYKGFVPQPTPESEPYWSGLKQHKLMLPHCTACNAYHFYPRPFCPKCFSWDNLEWKQATGKGTVATFVINHRPAMGYEDKAPYVIAVVELDEGPRMMSNLFLGEEPTPANVTVGMPVEMTFDDVTDEVTLPRFKPA